MRLLTGIFKIFQRFFWVFKKKGLPAQKDVDGENLSISLKIRGEKTILHADFSGDHNEKLDGGDILHRESVKFDNEGDSISSETFEKIEEGKVLNENQLKARLDQHEINYVLSSVDSLALYLVSFSLTVGVVVLSPSLDALEQ